MSRESQGRKAQAMGDLAESLVDVSLRMYQAEGRLAWAPTFPEIVVTSWTRARDGKTPRPKEVIITGNAPPDRVVCINGQLVWVEVKTWEAVNVHTLSRQLHQFSTMEDFWRAGALGCYLVMWRNKDQREWRLHTIPTIPVNRDAGPTEEGLPARLFVKEDGVCVRSPEEWPQWLPAIWPYLSPYLSHPDELERHTR